MAMQFAKEEIVAFDKVLEGFQDALVISREFKTYNLNNVMAERLGNTIWRPQPYIAQSFTGLDQTANFARTYAQLSVPTTLSYSHAVPLTLSATELRDLLQKESLGKAALQRLASDINVDCSNLAATSGTVVVKRTTAATGFDDLAAADTAMNRLGIDMNERKIFLSTADYNSMASNLAGRGYITQLSQNAYEKAKIPTVADFDAYKLDYAYRLTAATATGVTVTSANQRYVPVATTLDANGARHNVDNRYQNLPVTVTGGTIKVGDAFTIAGVNEVHHITKADTGALKTFRVTGIISGAGGTGTIQISPPIIAADSTPTDPELQQKNVVATPASGAAITFLNTVSAPVNPFWQADCFEIMPGHYQPAADSGMATMTATTDSGIQVMMTRQGAINDLSTKYRWDVFYGLVNLQPEMSGIVLFNQT
jgi:hypothetical protein